MPGIFFSCDCGMMLNVADDQGSGPMVDCPSCGASVRVPAVSKPKIEVAPEADPDLAQAPEPTSAGHENLAIISITLASLLTIGAIAFLLVPALRGSKDEQSDRFLASGSSAEDSGNKTVKPSRDAPNQAGRDAGPISADDPPATPLPRYTDPAPEPEPISPPAVAPGPPPPATSKEDAREKAPPPDPNVRQPKSVPDRASKSKVRIPPNLKAAPKPKPMPATAPSRASVKLEAARLLEWDGKKKEALAAFQAVADEFPRTTESGIAKARIDILKKALAPAIPKSSPEHGGITPRDSTR